MDTILANAVHSIRIAIEDSKSADPGRLMSAVRGVVAGMLLLFKERLRQLSPAGSKEAWLKAEFDTVVGADGAISVVGSAKAKTVTVHQIKERFDMLGVDVPYWALVKEAVALRNNIEHYRTGASPAELQAVVTKVSVVLRRFATEHLGIEPAKLLDPHTWGTMLQMEKVNEDMRRSCEDAMDKVAWPPMFRDFARELRCAGCYSKFFRPKDPENGVSMSLICGVCGNEQRFQRLAHTAVQRLIEGRVWRAHQAHEPVPQILCIHCNELTYLAEASRCFKCWQS